VKILFIGDIFGHCGRDAIISELPRIKEEYLIDICIANGENASGGKGLSLKAADDILYAGVDLITLGNHVWGNKEIMSFINDYPVIRPANMSTSLPGKGWTLLETQKGVLGVLNLQGRVYMEPNDSPFTIGLDEINEMRKHTNIIFVDFHAEASSEKIALAYYLDGMVSFVAGTHTHVQTADERILQGGTGFITDVGMTGPFNSIIGMDPKIVVDKFLTNFPRRFEPAKGKAQINAIVIDVDEVTGYTKSIVRINKIL